MLVNERNSVSNISMKKIAVEAPALRPGKRRRQKNGL
jgi:hypothetical protein